MREDLKKVITEKYSANYVTALEFTMSSEGMFANHPDDKGSMTYKGIARAFNGGWNGWKIVDSYLLDYPELSAPFTSKPTSLLQFNTLLEEDLKLNLEVYTFYYDRYYLKAGCDKVSATIGTILFDMSVLQGVKRAVKTLQKLLNRYYNAGLVVDGDFGNKTLLALGKVEHDNCFTSQLLLEYMDNLVEAATYRNNYKFLLGWMRRVVNLRNYLRLS